MGPLRDIEIEDAIADRVGHFVHWGDPEAIAVAERVAQTCKDVIDRGALLAAVGYFRPEGEAARLRLRAAPRRLLAQLDE